MVGKLYPCDPSKNKECNKRGCYQNGGPCRSTTHIEYSDTGDLISKQALLYALDDTELTDDGGVDINELEDLIKRMPTIEAEPVRHGRWIYIRGDENIELGLYECSECHKGDIHAKDREVPYCWNCGAKMDLDEVKNEQNKSKGSRL